MAEQPFGSGGDPSGKKIRWCLFRKESPTLHLDGVPQGYSYNQLSVATRGFSEDSKLGQGGSGSVYKGVLPSGIPVAVKEINAALSHGKGLKLFKDEISIICRLRHRNLIELLGWCEDVAKNKYLLVYELMPNGSLDDALFGQVGGKASLSWSLRFNIISGTADALTYLHQGWKKQVLHRDIKCSNIMLDENWDAMVGDFGIARLVDHGREPVVSNMFVGTHGYISPEVFEEGRFTDKADVYAFGVVVLEVVCGRRVSPDSSHPIGLVDWVWQNWSQGEDALLSTVDERLQDYDKEKIKVLLNTGLACCHPFPSERPSMGKVVQVLAGDAHVPSIPNSKPKPEFYFDPQILITSSLSFKTRSAYRSRFGLNRFTHSGFSVSRMRKRNTELTVQKDFAKKAMEVVVEEVGAQPILHELHVGAEAHYKACAGNKDGRCLNLHNTTVGAETKICTKNRTAEARRSGVKMDAETQVLENTREAEGADVPLFDEQHPGKMRRRRNVSQVNVPSTLSDLPCLGMGRRQRPNIVMGHVLELINSLESIRVHLVNLVYMSVS